MTCLSDNKMEMKSKWMIWKVHKETFNKAIIKIKTKDMKKENKIRTMRKRNKKMKWTMRIWKENMKMNKKTNKERSLLEMFLAKWLAKKTLGYMDKRLMNRTVCNHMKMKIWVMIQSLVILN